MLKGRRGGGEEEGVVVQVDGADDDVVLLVGADVVGEEYRDHEVLKDHRVKEEILVELEKKALLDLVVYQDPQVLLDQEEKEERKDLWANQAHLESVEGLVTKVLLEQLVPWAHLAVLVFL